MIHKPLFYFLQVLFSSSSLSLWYSKFLFIAGFNEDWSYLAPWRASRGWCVWAAGETFEASPRRIPIQGWWVTSTQRDDKPCFFLFFCFSPKNSHLTTYVCSSQKLWRELTLSQLFFPSFIKDCDWAFYDVLLEWNICICFFDFFVQSNHYSF